MKPRADYYEQIEYEQYNRGNHHNQASSNLFYHMRKGILFFLFN